MPEEDVQQREVVYSGRVQGVGFRYTVRMVAGRFAVTGFVKNLSDGRVQLVAEGRSVEIERFVQAVEDQMGGYIAQRRQQIAPASGDFQGFDVRF